MNSLNAKAAIRQTTICKVERTRAQQRRFNQSLRNAVRGYLKKDKALGVAIGAAMTMVAVFAASPASAQYVAGGGTAPVNITLQGILDRIGGAANLTLPDGTAGNTPQGVAIGTSTVYGGGTVIGTGNFAGVNGATQSAGFAFGNVNYATGAYAVAMGYANSASNTSAVSIGTSNTASGNTSIAMGRQSTASGNFAIAMGNTTQATAINAIALGNSAKATGLNAIAIGGGQNGAAGNLTDPTAANASGANSVALGVSATAAAANSYVGGYKAAVAVGATESIAIGSSATVASTFGYIAGTGSVAIGNTSSSTNDQQGIAIGAGANVTGKIISAGVIEGGNIAIGGNASATSTGVDTVNASSQIAIGLNAKTTVDGAISIGEGSTSTGFYATTTGSYAAATGAGSVATGGGAQATAVGAIAIGGATGLSGAALTGFAAASGVSSIAMGTSAASTAADAVAIGSNTSATAANAVAIGGDASAANAAIASGIKATALGYNSTAAGVTSIAAGSNSSSAGASSVALGNAASAANTYSIAIGESASATNDNAIAIGRGTVSSGLNGVAIGLLSSQNGGGTAVGNDSHSSGSVSTAIGYRDNALADFSTAIGTSNTAYGKNSIALGVNTVAGVAGSATTVISDIAIGNAAKATGGSSVALGDAAIASSAGAIAIGQGATAQNGKAVSIGVGNVADGDGAVAIGDPNKATGAGAIALGKDNTATGIGAVALGNTNTAIGQGSVALGKTSAANNAGSIALGDTANVSVAASKGVALGSGASVTAAGGVALGQGSLASRAAITAIADPLSTSGATVTTATGAVAVGGRQIINVAAGTQATDAVNVGQITPIIANLGNLGATTAAALGGTATYNPATGKISAPAYTISGTTYNDVGSALSALEIAAGSNKYVNVNSTLADGSATGSDSIAIGPLAKASAANTVALGNGATASNAGDVALGSGATTAAPHTGAYTVNGGTAAATSPASVVSVGKAGAERQIQNVAAGVVSATSTDAVNGSQLYIVGSAVNAVGTTVAANFGGGATYDPLTGKVASPSYSVGSGTYDNVGSALTALQTGAPVQYATAGAPTTANGLVPSNNMTLVGKTAGGVVLDNVAPGSTLAGSTQAINGGQLNTGLASVATNLGGGSTFDPVTGKVTAPSITVAGKSYSDVTSAIQAAGGGFNVTTAKSGTGVANGTSVANIAPGSTATITAGNNIITTQSGSTIDVAVNPVLTGLTSVGIAGGPTIAATGIDMAGKGITNLAAGSTVAGSTQAINGGQLNTGLASVATNFGGGAVYDPVTGKVTAPSYAIAGSTYTDVGSALGALASGGAKTKYFNANSALADSQATGTNAVAIGPNAQAAGNNAIASGPNAQAAGNLASAYGSGANAVGTNATALGANASANNTGDVALGSNSITTAPHTGAYTVNGGTAAGTAPTSVVSVGDTGKERQITNVAAGVVSATSTDAINGSQLFIVGSAVNAVGTTVAANLGGGAVYDPLTGKVSAPAYAVGSGSYGDVGSALAALQTGSPVQYATAGAPTTANGLVPSNNMTLVGAVPGGVVLDNVAPGSTVAGSTQAINGGQLNTGLASVATNLGGGAAFDPVTGTVTAPSYTVAGSNYNNVGSALGAVDTSLTNLTNGTSGLVQQIGGAPGSGGLTVGASTGGTTVNFAGTAGDRVLTGVAAGTIGVGSTQAVNGSQIAANQASVASTLGGGATVNPDGTLTAPSYTVGSSKLGDVGSAIAALQTGSPVQYATAGAPTTANGLVPSNNMTLVGAVPGGVVLDNVAPGSTVAGSTQAINGGQLNTGLASVATNLGGGAAFDPVTGTVTAPSYTIGATVYNDVGSALASLDNSVNGGAGIKYFHANSGLADSQAVGTDSVAIGPNAVANAAGSIALGAGSDASRGAVTAVLDPLSLTGATVTTTTGELSVGSSSAPRQITNVAAGTQVTDAVNVGQILPIIVAQNQLGTTTAANFGGGATYDPATGKISAPSYTVGGTVYTDTGTAIAALDKSVGSAIATNNTSNLANPVASGTDATAIAPGSVASGADAFAAGKNSLASGAQATAMGAGAQATGAQSVAIGNGAVASATSTTALGDNAKATAADATALGQNTLASGLNSTATGYGAQATGDKSLASGNGAVASGTSAVALGDGATATGNNSVALGAGSTDGGQANVVSVGAVGAERKIVNVAAGTVSATSTEAINGSQLYGLSASAAAALGGGSTVNSDGTITAPVYSVGGNAVTGVGGAITALDSSLTSLQNQVGGAIAVNNTSKLANPVATGTDATAISPGSVASGADALAAGKNSLASGAQSIALGNGAQATATSTTAVGDNAKATAADATALGQNTVASAANATATGYGAQAIGTAATATGNNAVASGLSAVAMGDGSKATGDLATAVGPGALASGKQSIALGSNAQATAFSTTAVGDGAVASAANATALGQETLASGLDSTATGYKAQSTGANSVALGANSTDGGQANVVSIGSVGAERKLVNVAAGAVSATSTDAVNGSQLNATNQQVAALDHRAVQYATGVGGSTLSEINLGSDAGGPVVIHNLAAGIADTDAANVGQVNAVAAVANNSAQYDKTSGGGKADSITFQGGTPGAQVTLRNVAAGVNATDAVNVGQMQRGQEATLASANSYTDQKVSNLAAFTAQGIKEAKQLAISGTAIALAGTGLRYDDRPGKTSVSGATSFYKGEVGLAFGIGHTSQDQVWRTNLSVNSTPWAEKPEIGVVVGATFSFN